MRFGLVSQQSSQAASKPASKPANKPAGRQASQQASKHASELWRLLGRLKGGSEVAAAPQEIKVYFCFMCPNSARSLFRSVACVCTSLIVLEDSVTL